MTSPRRARLRGDRGFTLVDTMLAVGLTSTIMGVLAAAIMVTLGPDQDALERSASSHDGQVASMWIPADVASAGPIDPVADTAPAATIACAGATPGANVLRLGWNRPVPVSTNTAVSYRTLQKGADLQLVRYACTDGGPPRSHVIVEQLQSADAVGVTFAGGRRVTVRFTTLFGESYSIGAARRTPNAPAATTTTLPPTTTTVPTTTTTSAPTTTTTVRPTTTTIPPTTTTTASCSVGSVIASPAAVSLHPSQRLEVDVTVRVTTTAACSGLRLSYVPGGTTPATVLTLTKTTATTWTVTIPGQGTTGAQTWTPGSKALRILPATGTTPYATSGTLTVR